MYSYVFFAPGNAKYPYCGASKYVIPGCCRVFRSQNKPICRPRDPATAAVFVAVAVFRDTTFEAEAAASGCPPRGTIVRQLSDRKASVDSSAAPAATLADGASRSTAAHRERSLQPEASPP